MKLLCGDSLLLIKTFENDSVDAIVTDPPYGFSFIGIDKEKEYVAIAEKRIANG